MKVMVKDPAGYEETLIEPDGEAEGIDIIWGLLDGEATKIGFIFDPEAFSEDAVLAWLEENNYQPFESAGFCLSYSGQKATPIKGGASFLKDIAKVGDYQKGGESIRIDRELMDHWVSTFSQWRAAGLKTPVPLGHTTSAEMNRGWVEGLFRSGDTLYAKMSLSDPGLSASQDVSLYSPAKFVDGTGKTWDKPLVHVALTPTPLLPGLGGFVSIEASRVPRYSLPSPSRGFEKLVNRLHSLGVLKNSLHPKDAEELSLSLSLPAGPKTGKQQTKKGGYLDHVVERYKGA